MVLIRFLFFAFLAYLAFKLIFNLIIPVYRTTRKLKKGFREMHEKMQQHTQQQQSQSYSTHVPDKKAPAGDYIEFEELK
jgi:hypothetical protein